jgi:hypothetical protein
VDAVEALLLVGGVGLGGYALWKVAGGGSSAPPPAPGVPLGAPKPPSLLAQAQLAAPYGSAAAVVGKAAQKAPTWLKLAVPVVGLNSVVQGVIDNPSGALKKAGGVAKSVGSATVGAGKTVVNSIGHAGSSVAHAIGSLF